MLCLFAYYSNTNFLSKQLICQSKHNNNVHSPFEVYEKATVVLKSIKIILSAQNGFFSEIFSHFFHKGGSVAERVAHLATVLKFRILNLCVANKIFCLSLSFILL
jgi:hypothetical protein